ncbi:MAG: NUDIX domain-containing protein [Candidatus Altiarchaeota archaeon]|nr:NUDIX domain-containing protein [Candidatus Altiarchaeota archaeon]
MKLLTTIKESDVILGSTDKQKELKPRQAARAVVIRNDNKIALLYVSKNRYYKLPGGGVEPGEEIIEGLEREIIEETGCKVKVIGKLGKTIELRNRYHQIQTSFCFLTQVIEQDKPNFTGLEKSEGFELKWVEIDKAIELIENSDPFGYIGKFIKIRDALFLRTAAKMIDI